MGCHWVDRRPAILPVENRWRVTGWPWVVTLMDADGNINRSIFAGGMKLGNPVDRNYAQ